MLGWLPAAGLLLLLLTPVRITVKARTGPQRRWQVHAAVWGLPLPPIDSLTRRPGPDRRQGERVGRLLLRILRDRRSARGLLARGLHVELAAVQGRVALDDAAAGALLCGGLNSLTALLPPSWRSRLRVCLLPDFTGGPTVFQFYGIAGFRLGTLLAGTALVWLSALRREKKEAAA